MPLHTYSSLNNKSHRGTATTTTDKTYPMVSATNLLSITKVQIIVSSSNAAIPF